MSSVSWTPDALYLSCILKRGSVLMLARFGGLVSLSTSGCDIEFGPAHFLPLHPLVTYRWCMWFLILAGNYCPSWIIKTVQKFSSFNLLSKWALRHIHGITLLYRTYCVISVAFVLFQVTCLSVTHFLFTGVHPDCLVLITVLFQHHLFLLFLHL